MRSMRQVRATQLPFIQVLIPTFLGCLLIATSALADTDAENAALARLIHEMETLDGVIRSAESQSDPDTRIRFRYDWLREDLERVRRGIQDHIDAPRIEPRSFPPLRGDYRQ
jgi:RAQPRD family integrative conjugative element protein